MITFRPATKKTLKPMAKAFIKSYPYSMSQTANQLTADLLTNKDATPICIYLDGHLIGFLSLGLIWEADNKENTFTMLDYIYIKPAFSGKGYATAIYKILKDEGLSGINLNPQSLLDNIGYFTSLGIDGTATGEVRGCWLAYGIFDSANFPIATNSYNIFTLTKTYPGLYADTGAFKSIAV